MNGRDTTKATVNTNELFYEDVGFNEILGSRCRSSKGEVLHADTDIPLVIVTLIIGSREEQYNPPSPCNKKTHIKMRSCYRFPKLPKCCQI